MNAAMENGVQPVDPAEGRSHTGERVMRGEAGVDRINQAYTSSTIVGAQGNAHRQVGRYTTSDGQTRAANDVWVQTNPTQSLPTEWIEVPADIAALPDAQGYGLVRDLHQAMAADARGEFREASRRMDSKCKSAFIAI